MKTRKILSLLLALIMIFSMMLASGVAVYADSPTYWVVYDTVVDEGWDPWDVEKAKSAVAGDTIKVLNGNPSGPSAVVKKTGGDDAWNDETGITLDPYASTTLTIPTGYKVKDITISGDILTVEIEPIEITGSAVITLTAALNEITGSVALNGAAKVGQQLTATFTSRDDTTTNPYTVKYAWYRVANDEEELSDANLIATTDANTYTLTDEDKGKMIKVAVMMKEGNNYWTDSSAGITAVTGETVGEFTTSYTMTFSADTTVSSGDFTALTNGLTVKNSTADEFDTAKKVTVTVASANNWELKAENTDTTVSYGLYENAEATEAKTTYDFSAAEIDAKNGEAVVGTTKAIGVKADADDIKNAKAGTYTDTVTFTASLADVQTGVSYTLTCAAAGGKVLTSDDLLATESSAVSYTDPATSKTVYAYNGYIKDTAGANWIDAMAFVQKLNDAGIVPTDSAKGTSGTWRLLSYSGNIVPTKDDDGYAWAAATSGEKSGFGGVFRLWSSSQRNNDDAYGWLCDHDMWLWGSKSEGSSMVGFVVIWAQN